MKPASEHLSQQNDAAAQRTRRCRPPAPDSADEADRTDFYITQKEEAEENAPPSEALAADGRLKGIAGVDFKRAAIDYPHKLDEDSKYYLRTKPFIDVANKTLRHDGRGLDAETQRFFHDFANIVTALGLRSGQTVLDVGCGPGWLSEFLARFGYDVTGIDISPAMIEVARERLQRVPYGVAPGMPLRYRFLAHDIEAAPLAQTFDAIICYDALHHFANERAVIRHFAEMLNNGGQLFILEGDKPAAGSPAERELVEEMQRFEVLESPFSGDYLRALLRARGFVITGDYTSVNGLFDRDTLVGNQLRVEPSPVNYLLCKKVSPPHDSANGAVPDSLAPGILRARLSLLEEWPQQIAPSGEIRTRLKIENTGDTVWLTGAATRRGAVTLGVKVFDEQGNLAHEFHGEPPLRYAIAPGEGIALHINYRAPSAPGLYKFKIDLIDQLICWFEQQGSQPLERWVRVE
ncbi:MAG: class I SAM-dependent methyltransferase [Pyrinomonadaceae bacterium]